MPWRIVAHSPRCHGGYAVVSQVGGQVMGCHRTRASAVAQLRALYAAEPGLAKAEGIPARPAAPRALDGRADGVLTVADAAVPRFRAAWLTAVRQLAASITIEMVTELMGTMGTRGRLLDLASGMVIKAVDDISEETTAAYRQAVLDSARMTIDAGPIQGEFVFDIDSPWVDEIARREAGRMVVEINRQTRRSISDIVLQATRDGASPAETQARIRRIVGLDSRRAKAVENYRRGLDELRAGTVSERSLLQRWSLGPRGLPRPGELTSARANQLADKYAARLRSHRAGVIARHESLTAANAGQHALWREADRRGVFRGDRVVRRWMTASDERVCPVCGPLDGVVVTGLGGRFTAGEGRNRVTVRHPPAHVMCRCVLTIEQAPQAREERQRIPAEAEAAGVAVIAAAAVVARAELKAIVVSMPGAAASAMGILRRHLGRARTITPVEGISEEGARVFDFAGLAETEEGQLLGMASGFAETAGRYPHVVDRIEQVKIGPPPEELAALASLSTGPPWLVRTASGGWAVRPVTVSEVSGGIEVGPGVTLEEAIRDLMAGTSLRRFPGAADRTRLVGMVGATTASMAAFHEAFFVQLRWYLADLLGTDQAEEALREIAWDIHTRYGVEVTSESLATLFAEGMASEASRAFLAELDALLARGTSAAGGAG